MSSRDFVKMSVAATVIDTRECVSKDSISERDRCAGRKRYRHRKAARPRRRGRWRRVPPPAPRGSTIRVRIAARSTRVVKITIRGQHNASVTTTGLAQYPTKSLLGGTASPSTLAVHSSRRAAWRRTRQIVHRGLGRAVDHRVRVPDATAGDAAVVDEAA